MRWLRAALLGLSLTPALTPGLAQAAPAPALRACALPLAVPAAVLDAPLLVLGEVHGTREIPQFVAAYLCTAARSRRKLTLALEYPASEQASLDRFFASSGASADVARLLSGPFWRRAMQDGRSSEDMLRLLLSIRVLRADGADLRVLAIDSDGVADQRDAAMADHLRSALRQEPGRQVLALLGALHAVRSKGNRFDPQYESAVFRLADQHPLALTVATAGGQAWVCQASTAASCQVTEWDINRVSPAPAALFTLTPPSPQFDGMFYVGETTASPPAVQP